MFTSEHYLIIVTEGSAAKSHVEKYGEVQSSIFAQVAERENLNRNLSAKVTCKLLHDCFKNLIN